MSFEQPMWPEWAHPPMMIGGHAVGAMVLAKSVDTIIWIRQVLAYPTGVEIDIEAHGRGNRPGGRDATGHLPFGVRYSDGRETVLNDSGGIRSGAGPTLTMIGSTSSGGQDGGWDYEIRL